MHFAARPAICEALECLQSDRTLDYVGAELETAVRQEAFECVTTLDRVP